MTFPRIYKPLVPAKARSHIVAPASGFRLARERAESVSVASPPGPALPHAELESGEIGIGYAGGRAPRQAEIAAAIDALGQRSEWRDILEARIVAPLATEAEARRRLAAARAAATKVDFFTVAREAGT